MDIRKVINQTKYFLLDMDGTIYIDETPIGDMKNTLNAIRRSGRKIIYLTNNSSKSFTSYEEKLKRIGLFEKGDTVYSSGTACCEYLCRNKPNKKVFLLGTESLYKEFYANGIKLVSDEKADVAVLAFDTELNYDKICRFNEQLVKGAYYIATHPDNVCPAENTYIPDAGSFISLFQTSSGRLPDKIIGKPYQDMGSSVIERFSAQKDEIIMVGDRLNTDIAFGLNCGFHTLLVLSGETTEQMRLESPVKPELVLQSLNDLVKYL